MRFLIFCTLLVTTNLFSQNKRIDSLVNLINKDKQDTLLIFHLNRLCIEHYFVGNLNKCIEISQQVINISEKLHYEKGLYCAYDNLGSIYNETNNVPEALNQHFKALKLCSERTNKKDFALINCNISSALINAKKHKEALPYCYTSLRIFKELKLHYEASNCCNNLGLIYVSLSNYILASGYFNLALNESLNTNNFYYIANSYAALGFYNLNTNNYNKSIYYYGLAIENYKAINNEAEIGLCFNNIALSLLKQNKTEQSEFYLKKAMTISKENNDIETLSDGYLYNSLIDSVKQNYKSAYQNYKKHVVLKNQLLNEDVVEKSVKARMQHDFDLKQIAIDAKIKQEKLMFENKRNRIVAIVVFMFLILAIAYLYFSFKQKQKIKTLTIQQLNLEKQLVINETNLLRLQINPHLIFNTLNSINSFIISNKNIEAENYLIKFSRLLRATLNQTNNSLILLEEELNTLKDYIELEQLRLNNSFNFIIDVDVAILSALKIPPLVLQPFVENAIIHGLKHRNDALGLLKITIKETSGQLVVTIFDNGIGRKKSSEKNSKKHPKHEPKGIEITKQRIEYLKSSKSESKIEIIDLYDSNELAIGTEVLIILPSDL